MPLMWLSLAFVAGVLSGGWLKMPAPAWLAAGVILPGAAWLAGRRGWLRLNLPLPAAAVLLAFCLGGLRWQLALPGIPTPDELAFYNDTGAFVDVEGVVVQPADERDAYTNLRVQVDRIYLPEGDAPVAVRGLLLARVEPYGGWQYGDRLRLFGELQTPPEDELFSYQEYLARQGVYTMLDFPRTTRLFRGHGSPLLAGLYHFKSLALDEVYRLFPDPEASLLAGILLGVETGIPQPVRQAFQDTGTAHIIAISGFNITILAGLFSALFARLLGRWRGAVAATLGIAVYTLLVGGGAAAVRAALMGGLSVFAAQLGRRQEGLNSLAFVAALMALFDPNIPGDVGFQLSFAATLGLVLYAGPLTAAFAGFAGRILPPGAAARLSALVGEYFLFTLAAQITTLPVTAYYFRQIPLIGLLANPLVLPAQPALMVLGGAALLLGLIFHPLGQLAAYAAWPFAAFTIRTVEFLGGFGGAVFALGSVPGTWVVLFYAALLLPTFFASRLARLWPRLRPAAVATGLGVLALLAWKLALAAPDGRLHLVVLDVSRGTHSGAALLVQTPNGRHVLINGGPSATALSDALGRWLPLNARRLDALVVASSGDDQVQALPAVLERFPPQMVLWAGTANSGRAARNLRVSLNGLGIEPQPLEAGQVLDLGQGARLRVESAGGRGAVLWLEWGSFRALLPLGLDFPAMEQIMTNGQPGPVSALLLAESGFAPLNPPEWIAWLDPQVALLSVAPGDRNGLPDAETLDALDGYTLLRTDQNGWIELSTDGESLWVEVERR